MNKEEILMKSRNEYKNLDLVEMEARYQAGNIAGRVGATMCVLLSIIAGVFTGEYLVSPWIIYFSILGSNWFVRFIKLKKKTDLVISVSFIGLDIVLLVVQIMQFTGASL